MRAQLRHQRPVAADHALHQALVREAVQAALLAVARRGREHQREIARLAGLEEAPLELADQLVGRAGADEARAGDRVAVANDGDRFGRRDDLVLHRASVPYAARRRDCASAVSARRKSSIKPNLLIGHQRGRMPTIGYFDGTHASLPGGDSAFLPLLPTAQECAGAYRHGHCLSRAVSVQNTITCRTALPSCRRSKPSLISSSFSLPVIRRLTGKLPCR